MTLDDDEVRALGEPGWFMREAFLGHGSASAAAASARRLLHEGAFRPAEVGQGGQRRKRADVRDDALLWLSAHHPDAALDALWVAFEALRLCLNAKAWLGLTGFELQLAHYPPTGARYQRHRDAFRGDLARRITAIVYLNPLWRLEHGGMLELCTHPPSVIAPTLDRLVVFRSELVEHEVLPSFADRFAATAWFRGA